MFSTTLELPSYMIRLFFYRHDTITRVRKTDAFESKPIHSTGLIVSYHFFHEIDEDTGSFGKFSIFQPGKNNVAFDVFLKGDGKDILVLVVLVDFGRHQSQPNVCSNQAENTHFAVTRIKNRRFKPGLPAFIHNQLMQICHFVEHDEIVIGKFFERDGRSICMSMAFGDHDQQFIHTDIQTCVLVMIQVVVAGKRQVKTVFFQSR
jgi:hypothetical protein